jgi:hypothetical protein
MNYTDYGADLLMVDDDPRRFEILSCLGFVSRDAIHADNAVEGIRLIQERPWRALLLDHDLFV